MRRKLVAVITTLMLSAPGMCLAATAGPSFGGTFTDANGGSADWITPSNAGATDTTYTTCTSDSSDGPGDRLQVTNFGFSIPTGSTINGITVSIRRKGSSTNVIDSEVKLIKAGAVQTTNKALVPGWSTSDTTATYGGAADLWSTTWTVAQINASNFGVNLQTDSSSGTVTASVDSITVTITYTPPAPDLSTWAMLLLIPITAYFLHREGLFAFEPLHK